MGICSAKRQPSQPLDLTEASSTISTGRLPDDYFPEPRPTMQRRITIDHLQNTDQYSEAQLQETQNLIQELFATEETYIAGLRNIYEIFLHPLWTYRAIGKEVLEKFECVKQLWNFHTDFLDTLGRDFDNFATPKHGSGPRDTWVSLRASLNQMAKLYEVYIHEYPAIIETITNIQRKSKVVCQHFNDAPYPIDAFILLPIQRITRYRLLFSKLLKFTPSAHPDHQNLDNIVTGFHAILTDINEQRDRQLHLLAVGSKLKNLNQPFTTHDRQLVAEKSCFFDKCTQQAAQKQLRDPESTEVPTSDFEHGYFVLCTDCLLFCDKSWSVFVWINLKRIDNVQRVGDHLVISRRLRRTSSGLKRVQSTRRLSHENLKSAENVFTLYAISDEECEKWYEYMQTAMSNNFSSDPDRIGFSKSTDDIVGFDQERQTCLANANTIQEPIGLIREFHKKSKSISMDMTSGSEYSRKSHRSSRSRGAAPESGEFLLPDDNFGIDILFGDDMPITPSSRPNSIRSVAITPNSNEEMAESNCRPRNDLLTMHPEHSPQSRSVNTPSWGTAGAMEQIDILKKVQSLEKQMGEKDKQVEKLEKRVDELEANRLPPLAKEVDNQGTWDLGKGDSVLNLPAVPATSDIDFHKGQISPRIQTTSELLDRDSIFGPGGVIPYSDSESFSDTFIIPFAVDTDDGESAV